MICHCDGPPHQYDPSWCITPKFGPGVKPPTTIVVPVGATVIVVKA